MLINHTLGLALIPHVSTNYILHRFFEYVIDPLYIRSLSRNASRRHGLFAPMALTKMAMDRLLEGLDVSKIARKPFHRWKQIIQSPIVLGIGRV